MKVLDGNRVILWKWSEENFLTITQNSEAITEKIGKLAQKKKDIVYS